MANPEEDKDEDVEYGDRYEEDFEDDYGVDNPAELLVIAQLEEENQAIEMASRKNQ